MDVRQYLDATYLKTAEQAGLTESQNTKLVKDFVLEGVSENYKLVMLRPDMVSMARNIIDDAGSKVLVGTVIDFPNGNATLKEKLIEAEKAIADGADELDFVVDYNSFVEGYVQKVEDQVVQCTTLALGKGKAVKWIIEIAALNNAQIAQITCFIKDVVVANFNEADYHRVFVKSSTGFYKAEGGKPNGATIAGIKIMLENAGPLPVKAAGGVKNYEDAVKMIKLGVKRIGTSSAAQIVAGEEISDGY
jgi:deoxyribose-phosphate aldolase